MLRPPPLSVAFLLRIVLGLLITLNLGFLDFGVNGLLDGVGVDLLRLALATGGRGLGGLGSLGGFGGTLDGLNGSGGLAGTSGGFVE